MESQPLPISLCETQERSDSPANQLIKQWLFRFGVEHKEDIAPRLPLWLEAFGGMKPEKLEPMFKKALQTCKFFPKIADILENASDSQAKLAELEAECGWNEVLDLRARYWSPDAPGGFWRGMPPLSAQVKQACRAAGVFREFTSAEFESGALHTWGKKRFIESYLAWKTLEKEKHLLPDGPIKNLLTDTAQKLLPAKENLEAGNARPSYLDEPVIPANERWGAEEQSASLKLRQGLPKKFRAWESRDQRKQIEAELAEYGHRVKAIAQEKGVTLP